MSDSRQTTMWTAQNMLNSKLSSQTQLEGNKSGLQPYRRHRASLKAPLCNAKRCSDNGSAVKQLEEPLSPDSRTDL